MWPGLPSDDLRLAGGDLRALHIDLRIDVLDAGLGGRDLGLGQGQRDAVVALVDAGDHGAGRDVLIVGDGDGRDVARHLGGDGELAGGDERRPLAARRRLDRGGLFGRLIPAGQSLKRDAGQLSL